MTELNQVMLEFRIIGDGAEVQAVREVLITLAPQPWQKAIVAV